MKKENILGFDIITYNSQELLNNIFADYEKKEQLFIVNINPEIVTKNYKNEKLKEILNNQKYQIPDGIGIVWASKNQKGQIKERITGIDLMQELCKKSQEYQAKIFLYGGKQGISEKAKCELEKTYKGINIIGTCDGYVEETEALKQIRKSNPDILFVGLGSPKQEEFIIKHKDELSDIKILMPIGGSLDVISNTKKRAPNWVIKCNLEWLYRLIKEPKRIFRRVKLLKFIWLVNRKRRKNNEEN